MPVTVGQITDKISELRSKIAVTEGVILYLKSNYLSPEDQKTVDERRALRFEGPEMKFVRDDRAVVPEEHVNLVIADYVEYLDSLRLELSKWENLVVQEPPAAKLGARDDDDNDDDEEPKPAPTPQPEPKPAADTASKPKPPPQKPAAAPKEKPSVATQPARGHQDQPAPGQAGTPAAR